MTSLTDNAFMVAMVQAASTPVQPDELAARFDIVLGMTPTA